LDISEHLGGTFEVQHGENLDPKVPLRWALFVAVLVALSMLRFFSATTSFIPESDMIYVSLVPVAIAALTRLGLYARKAPISIWVD
jgi:hypothetical protein